MDLNLLRTFVSVHETGSLTRTARALQVTQPSVSHALARLRKHFDDPLFLRTRQGMRPTALATELYASFKDSLIRIDRTVDSTRRFDPGTAQRRFRICLTDVGEMSLLPQVLEHLAREAPGVELEVVPMQIERVADWLTSGRVDAAITSAPVSGPLGSAVFLRDRYVCLVRQDFPLVDGRMTMPQFLAGRHAVVNPNTGHRAPEQVLEQLQVTRKTTVTLQHFSVLPHIVHTCGLIAIIPGGAARTITERWPLQVVDPPFVMSPFEVRLLWQARDRETAAQLWFRQTVLDALAPADEPADEPADRRPGG